MTKSTVAIDAYLAGLIDGDGSVMIKKRLPLPSNHMAVPKYTVSLYIGMTDLAAVQFVCVQCGDPVERVSSRVRKAHHKTYYEYARENAKAVALLKRIQPYSITKKLQIKAALELADLRSVSRLHRTKVINAAEIVSNDNSAKTQKVMGLSDDFVEKCESIYQRQKIGNTRSGRAGAWSPSL